MKIKNLTYATIIAILTVTSVSPVAAQQTYNFGPTGTGVTWQDIATGAWQKAIPQTAALTQGQSTTISWTSDGTSCTGSRGGSYGPSGSFTDSPSSTTTYGMTCSKSGWNSGTDSVTVTVGGAANRTPVGYHDTVNNSTCRTTGWAYDPDSSSTSIEVHMYIDGEAGAGGTILKNFPTNIFRSDVNSTYGISGNHGFDVNLSPYIADGKSHPLYVYGIDTAGGANTKLTNSPKTIQCAGAPGLVPSVDIKGQ